MNMRVHAPKLQPGDKVAVLSPAFAAPAIGPAVHEQAMRRLAELTGLIPVEYPTTRKLGATAEERAADVNAAFADPEIRAILATVGGSDQITVIRHLDPELARADPKPFLGYSDNTNLLNWLWSHGVAGFYGGSTQVHLGAGPAVDPEHLTALTAALFTGERLELTEPGESEDYGREWSDVLATSEGGLREATEPWVWAGPEKVVTGPTWGGCLEVIDQLAIADRLPSAEALERTILLWETSEEMPEPGQVRYWVRALGERGLLGAVAGVAVARTPGSALGRPLPDAAARAKRRADQRDVMLEEIGAYNPDAVVCIGPPFGHTKPQWIVPYGGEMTLDGVAERVFADYA